MSILDGIGLSFHEAMAGKMKLGAEDVPVRLNLGVESLDLVMFLEVGEHRADVSGTIHCDALGGELPVRDGSFYLYRPDPDAATYHLVYHFSFDPPSGPHTFHGEKTLHRDPREGPANPVLDMTRMQATVSGSDGAVVATGELRFDLADLPSFIASIKVEGTHSPWAEIAGRVAFLSFVLGTLRQEYVPGLMYDTQYENLVLQGRAVSGDGVPRPFFLVMGVHDRGFPWGDGEVFWDVLLLLGDGTGGFRRFAITGRYLPGMTVEVTRGVGRYAGPLYEVPTGQVSFSQLHRPNSTLVHWDANLQLSYHAHEYEVAAFPFRTLSAHLPTWSTRLFDALHELVPGSHPLGIWIVPHTLTEIGGTLQLGDESVDPR